MSQEQPRRPQKEPIKYGDVFPAQGELAEKPITPVDAAVMQSAETTMLGKTKKGGAASTMQAAAAKNERGGVVAHFDVCNFDGEQDISIGETDLPGRRIITEEVGGQVLGQYTGRVPLVPPSTFEQGGGGGGITIGEALEATAMTAGKKPVGRSDAAAIQVAEARATGCTHTARGGVAAEAQSAANLNARTTRVQDKIKLADVLSDATTKLPGDRAATRGDAEGVTDAEMRNDPYLTTHPTGVAASVAAAARLNQNKDKLN